MPIVTISSASGKNDIRDGCNKRGCPSVPIRGLRRETSVVDLGNIGRGHKCFHEVDKRGTITVGEI